MKRQLAAVISDGRDSAPVTADRTTERTPSAPTARSYTSTEHSTEVYADALSIGRDTEHGRSPAGLRSHAVRPQEVDQVAAANAHRGGIGPPEAPASSTAKSSRPARVRYWRRRIPPTTGDDRVTETKPAQGLHRVAGAG